jgi:hypothetical protein
MHIKIPVSVGELFDKLSILEIKRKKVTDVTSVENVLHEYNQLCLVAKKHDIDFFSEWEYQKLCEINSELWDIEDGKRACERNKDFGETFIELARQVYIKNDYRATIKAAINKKYKSDIVEVKSHKKY